MDHKEFMEKDCARLAGRIAEKLAVKSPFIDILPKWEDLPWHRRLRINIKLTIKHRWEQFKFWLLWEKLGYKKPWLVPEDDEDQDY